jgi:hypothetical protein
MLPSPSYAGCMTADAINTPAAAARIDFIVMLH